MANLNNLNHAFELMRQNGNGEDWPSVMETVQAVPSLIDAVSVTPSPLYRRFNLLKFVKKKLMVHR